MSYSQHLAKVIADQLERFITLNRYQLAGHVANLDFWIEQAWQALAVIDGYLERLELQKAGQAEYVANHETKVWPADEPYLAGPPELPRRLPNTALREARHSVAEAAYRFLIRLRRDGLIDGTRVRACCERLGIGVDEGDL